MTTIHIDGTTMLTRAGAYIRLDKTDITFTGEITPTIIESRWIDPDKAESMLDQAGIDDLRAFFAAWHSLAQALRDEWVRSQREQNPLGGIMPGNEAVEGILRCA